MNWLRIGLLIGSMGGAFAQQGAQVGAEPKQADPSLHWTLGSGYNYYQESGVVFQGPELVTSVRWDADRVLSHLKLEADVFLGQQNYRGDASGELNGISNVETRWRVLYPLGVASSRPTWYTGLAMHTLDNDFNGKTTLNASAYRRTAVQLWWTFRWQHDTGPMVDGPSKLPEAELGWLLRGRHVSHLSDVGSQYSDAINTQTQGWYAQIKTHHTLGGAGALEPYLRVTWLGASDSVFVNSLTRVTEPDSRRIQLGLNWTWSQ